MSAPVLFESPEFAVRTVNIDGTVWFFAADVCASLNIGNTTQAVSYLDADETTLISNEGRPVNVVNEPGMWSLVLKSRKPEAKRFKRWLTHEVIPEIRRTGSYNATPALPQSFAEALELAAAQAREIEALEAQAELDAPKVEAFDTFLDADGAMTMNDAAHRLGVVGSVTLFRLLREAKVLQSREGSKNLPYRDYDHYFKVVTKVHVDRESGRSFQRSQTLVRTSGLDFIRRKLDLASPAPLQLVPA